MREDKVVDRLRALGLTEYEARVFSALTRLGEAGVGQIHTVAQVPRSAVYGALEKLERRGMVEASTGRPKKFRAVPPEAAVSRIESEFRSSLRDAQKGLEDLASKPPREVSDARIWIIKGKARVRAKIEDIIRSAECELLVAGSSDGLLEYESLWAQARKRRLRVMFTCPDDKKVAALSRYGEVLRPRFRMKTPEENPPNVLFVRADRRVILFASEYEDEDQVEGMTAFWTDDASIVRFMNYLSEPLSPTEKR